MSRLRAARTSSSTASQSAPSKRRARGLDQRCEGEANTSRLFRARCSCSSTHTTYASRSTAPCGRSGLAYTALRHAGGTSLSSTSRGSSGLTPTFRRASAGRPRTPARTRFPALAASSAFDSPSNARNGRTVAYRFASAARMATSAEPSGACSPGPRPTSGRLLTHSCWLCASCKIGILTAVAGRSRTTAAGTIATRRLVVNICAACGTTTLTASSRTKHRQLHLPRRRRFPRPGRLPAGGAGAVPRHLQ